MSTPTKEDPDLSSASLTPKGTSNRPLIAQGSRRRAAKNLLRDYYVKPANASGSGSGETRLDAHQQFQQLYNNSSLKDLLAKDQELRSETGELESERQGLVYTRYHDLLDASDTIKAVRGAFLSYCTGGPWLMCALGAKDEIQGGIVGPELGELAFQL